MTFHYGFDDENIEKTCRSHVQFILSDIILAQWRHPVASSKALDLLYWAMHAVLYRRTAAAINMANFIRNGFMPHIMGYKLSHIYAHEVR
jgi:hypothetical protein